MLYAPLTSAMRATCPAHIILLALITLTILGEEYKPCIQQCKGYRMFFSKIERSEREADRSPPSTFVETFYEMFLELIEEHS
jgi:hypothetical protein